MKILIVEDEKPASDKLVYLLLKIDNALEVVGIIETVEGTINYLQNNPSPDLILMDIQLDDGVCFEIFETIKVNIPVIFTTAYNEYALQAFKVNSVDYLLKPIEEGLLQQAIDKFKTIHFNNYKNIGTVTKLFNEYNKQFKTRFLIKVGSHYKSILVNDICSFYILERSTFLNTFSGQNYAVDDSLENLQKILNPDKFFRINRNYLINIDSITDIISYSSSRLILKLKNNSNNPELVVSREKVSEFKRWIDK
jgi:DNA-binding LytR/AlgR family response regulator